MPPRVTQGLSWSKRRASCQPHLPTMATMPSRRAAVCLALLLAGCPAPPEPPTPCGLTAAEVQALEAPGHSVARVWNEQALAAIRLDLPVPTVHARNLFHLSAALWDAWAAYEPGARGVFFTEKHVAQDVAAARREALSVAAWLVLASRYAQAARGPRISTCLREQLERLGYADDARGREPTSPWAVGRRVGLAVLAASAHDGANEANGYQDTTGWAPGNTPLKVDFPGGAPEAPDLWQQLEFSLSFSQNGIDTGGGVQPYMGPHWGGVTPFALVRAGEGPYLDAGVAPRVADPRMAGWVLDVLRRQAAFAPDAGARVDISPGARGNHPLGTNAGLGHAVNPVTGRPYAPQVVPVRDFGRVLAEYWADGPRSETPPGHWNVFANQLADRPDFARHLGGQGPVLDPLAWDVKVYLALNGALHDAAIVAWEVKRAFTASRPISLARHYAARGGLPEVPGLLEVATAQTLAAGGRHAGSGASAGQPVVVAWTGEPLDTVERVGRVTWLPLERWVPYQRRTFVTPAFPGFVSGHSTFSRAAAEVLADLTGSPFFPGGLHEFVAERGRYLQFEAGPDEAVRLQWATYFDAADQAGESRLWGGIHLEPDDLVGRQLGAAVGRRAVAHARTFFAAPAP